LSDDEIEDLIQQRQDAKKAKILPKLMVFASLYLIKVLF
jgi:hypothetical protein